MTHTDLKGWLLESAYPLWAAAGIDRDRGGFYEMIDAQGKPVEADRRLRAHARQVYSFAIAGRLGWRGPWKEIAGNGLDYLVTRYRRPDGLFCRLVGADGDVLDPTPTLYEQAFTLFAMAHCVHDFGNTHDLKATAHTLLDALETRRLPHGGFLELDEHPYQANAHMHLLEAMLAWGAVDNDPRWNAIAGEIAALCIERFIRADSGCLHEFFSEHWDLASGTHAEQIEPGHQIEWSYLLLKWSERSGDTGAQMTARGLFDKGVSFVDESRSVAPGVVRRDGRVTDPVARLWPQTEWLRAAIAFRRAHPGHTPYAREVERAARAVRRYLDFPTSGLWHERMDASGAFLREPTRATSLYHIIGVIAEEG